MSTDARTGPAPAPTGPLSTIDYTERIPNNVNLAEDRRLHAIGVVVDGVAVGQEEPHVAPVIHVDLADRRDRREL